MGELSPRFKLSAFDWKKILTGFVIAIIGAVIVLIMDAANAAPTVCVESVMTGCFDTKIVLIPLASTVVNMIRKWAQDRGYIIAGNRKD